MNWKAISVGALVVLGIVPFAMGATEGKPSDRFRREHIEIKTHLRHIQETVGKLASMPTSKQKAGMDQVLKFLKGHIVPHAEWEDAF